MTNILNCPPAGRRPANPRRFVLVRPGSRRPLRDMDPLTYELRVMAYPSWSAAYCACHDLLRAGVRSEIVDTGPDPAPPPPGDPPLLPGLQPFLWGLFAGLMLIALAVHAFNWYGRF